MRHIVRTSLAVACLLTVLSLSSAAQTPDSLQPNSPNSTQGPVSSSLSSSSPGNDFAFWRKAQHQRPLNVVKMMPKGVIPPRFSAPAGAHLDYYGGPVISNIEVVVVFWGSGSYDPTVHSNISNFYSDITNSRYMDLLAEYSTLGVPAVGGGQAGTQTIGHGTLGGTFTIPPSVTSSTISDPQIQSELQQQILAGHLPPPSVDAGGNVNTIYMVYFPHGKTITQGGSNSCQGGGFCAYHGTYVHNSLDIPYGVLPDMQAGSGCDTGCGNAGTTFGNETSVSSHEFAEAITDEAVGLAVTNGPPLAWYDNTNGEIGDICNAQQGTITANGTTYVVQQEFSNAQQNCTLTPNDFSISASPNSLSVAQGASGTSTIATVVASGGASTVSLAVTGLPSGANASFSPTSVTAGASSMLTVNAGTAAPGVYSLTVTGKEGIETHTATVSLTITAGVVDDFSILASPNSLSVVQGASGTSSISTAVVSGVAGTVSLAAIGLPSGASASLSPTSVTAGGSSVLTVNAGTAAPGVYAIAVTGVEGSMSHSADISLTVTAPVANDFSISASPNSFSIAQGASGGSTISTATTSGSAQTVALSLAGLPAGASASFSPPSVTSGQIATLTISAGAAAPGVYPLSVTGTATSGAHATSVLLTITGAKLSSMVQVVSSVNPALPGQPVTYTAAVSSSMGGTPTGTVKFQQGGSLLAAVPLAGGIATYTTSYPAVGTFYVKAVYSGDAQYTASTSTAVKETVSLSPVTVSVTADANPSAYGQAVTFTATLSTSGPSLDGQTVVFTSAGSPLGNATISGGVASITTPALNAGMMNVRAAYGGDSLHHSASGSTPHKVTKAVTTMALSSSTNPSPLGQDVTFTAVVSSPLVTPTGTVTFKSGSTVLGTVALAGGAASVTTNALTAGNHLIAATLSSSNFALSSASLTQQVQ